MTAGRPRAFDYDTALDQAMRVFWAKGFEGTSMPDLTAAMNMNRPSIYAAFGNKEELFRKALARYAEKTEILIRDLLDAPTLRASLERFLKGSADSFSCKETPRGCFSIQGALVGSADSAKVCDEAKNRREMVTRLLRERLDRARAEGELPDDADCGALARFYTAVLNGMAIQSVNGASCADMKDIARTALDALPVTK